MTKLGALDLNEYEGRAYLALLGRGALTAYELGRHSGIPLSRCYEVARSLARKGIVLVQPGEAPRYRAVEPTELLARRRAEQARELDALEAELTARAQTERTGEPVWVLRGRAAILARAAALASAARARLSVWAPADALAELQPGLGAARAHGARVHTIEHDGALVVERDGAEVLLGELSPPDACLATLTTQPGVVDWLARSARSRPAHTVTLAPAPAAPDPEPRWLDWETAKIRRLLASVPGLAPLESE